MANQDSKKSPASESALVLAEVVEPKILRVTLNRPEKRNAMSNQLLTQLFELMREADRDDSISVVIIRGAGVCFSSGYDIRRENTVGVDQKLPRHADRRDGYLPRYLVNLWHEMWDYSKPFIAQVHGYCLAGGTELAAACDLMYVAEDAVIGYPPVRRMTPPGSLWQPWLMGMRRAMEAVLTGDAMSGTEAVAAGFANRAFPAAELEDQVLSTARRVALIPLDLLTLNRRGVRRAMEVMGMRTAMRVTTELHALSWHTDTYRKHIADLEADISKAVSARDAPFGDYGASKGS